MIFLLLTLTKIEGRILVWFCIKLLILGRQCHQGNLFKSVIKYACNNLKNINFCTSTVQRKSHLRLSISVIQSFYVYFSANIINNFFKSIYTISYTLSRIHTYSQYASFLVNAKAVWRVFLSKCRHTIATILCYLSTFCTKSWYTHGNLCSKSMTSFTYCKLKELNIKVWQELLLYIKNKWISIKSTKMLCGLFFK